MTESQIEAPTRAPARKPVYSFPSGFSAFAARVFCSLLLFAAARGARAEDVGVAVAANFASTLEKLAPRFEKETGHTLVISSGPTGALYAQIKAGAPFDVFLSADAERPAQLEKEGLGSAGSRFVYAQGKLVLWSPRAGVDAHGKLLRDKKLGKVALADPEIAPYGRAAQEALSALGLWQVLQEAGSLVLGSSVTHAYQFAASGNVTYAFVAYAQVLEGKKPGSLWRVPQNLYTPLLQEAVLLKRGAAKASAVAFLKWLRSDNKVLAALRAAGYETPLP